MQHTDRTAGSARGLRLHFSVVSSAAVAANVGPSLMSASFEASSRPAGWQTRLLC